MEGEGETLTQVREIMAASKREISSQDHTETWMKYIGTCTNNISDSLYNTKATYRPMHNILLIDRGGEMGGGGGGGGGGGASAPPLWKCPLPPPHHIPIL